MNDNELSQSVFLDLFVLASKGELPFSYLRFEYAVALSKSIEFIDPIL
jgi:hypothetical protein